MAGNCKNCGTCTCTGVTLTVASNGQPCCTKCLAKIEAHLNALKANLKLT
jgi:hypothetical protein